MAESSSKKPYLRTDRIGLKSLVAFVHPDIARAIKMAAVRTDSRVQTVLEEAIVQWLKRYEGGDEEILQALIAARDKRSAAERTAEVSPAREESASPTRKAEKVKAR